MRAAVWDWVSVWARALEEGGWVSVWALGGWAEGGWAEGGWAPALEEEVRVGAVWAGW